MCKIKRIVIRNALSIEEQANIENIMSSGNPKSRILEVIGKALYNSDRRDRLIQIELELYNEKGIVRRRFYDV